MQKHTKLLVVSALLSMSLTSNAGLGDFVKKVTNPKKIVELTGNALTGGTLAIAKKTIPGADRTIEHLENQAAEEIDDAVAESENFANNQLRSYKTLVEDSFDRIGDGDLFGAAYHLTADPYFFSEQNSIQAFQESDLLRVGAQKAVGLCLGPAGEAGFVGYYDFRTEGDLEDAAAKAAFTYATGELVKF